MLKTLARISAILAILSSRVSTLLLAFVAFILLLQVILRYVFNAALPWPEEAARYAMVWVVLLISKALVREAELVNVDFFDKLWPTKFIFYRDTAYRLMLLVLLFVLFKEGLIQAIAESRQRTTALDISWFWPYLSIPVGTGLMLFQMIYIMILDAVRFTERRQRQ